MTDLQDHASDLGWPEVDLVPEAHHKAGSVQRLSNVLSLRPCLRCRAAEAKPHRQSVESAAVSNALLGCPAKAWLCALQSTVPASSKAAMNEARPGSCLQHKLLCLGDYMPVRRQQLNTIDALLALSARGISKSDRPPYDGGLDLLTCCRSFWRQA